MLVICEFLDEAAAFEFERKLISDYGRLCDGGILCNRTTGGDGVSGVKRSKEYIEKMAASLRGIKRSPDAVAKTAAGCRGKKRTPEQINNLVQGALRRAAPTQQHLEAQRRSHLGRGGKAVIDDSSGTVYPCMRAAADAIKISVTTLAYRMKSAKRNRPSMRLIEAHAAPPQRTE